MAKGKRIAPPPAADAGAAPGGSPPLFRPGLLRRYSAANDNLPTPAALLRLALKLALAGAALGALLWALI